MSLKEKELLKEAIAEICSAAKAGKLEYALDRLDRLAAEQPNESIVAYARAQLLGYYAEPHDGLQAAQQYVDQFPGDFNGPRLVAHSLARMGKYHEALAQIDRSEAMGRSTDISKSMRAEYLHALGRKAEAIALINSDGRPAMSSLAGIKMWANLSQPTDDVSLAYTLTMLKDAGERNEELAIIEATWYVKQGRLERALDIYNSASERYPEYERIAIYHAAVERRLGRAKESLARLEEAFRRNPTSYPLGRFLINCYLSRLRLLAAVSTVYRLAKAQIRVGKSPRA